MRAMVVERPHSERLAGAVLAVIISTALRLLFPGTAQSVPFVTYFPAVLIVAAFLGYAYALAVLAASTILAAALFLWPLSRPASLTSDKIILLLLFDLGALAMILVTHILRRAVVELDERARQTESFNAELRHRTRNMLQLVGALANRASRAPDPQEYLKLLSGRLEALAKANELLRFGALPACNTRELVESCLSPFTREKFHVKGPDCPIAKSAATPFMMALHELCTNAAKHGALSTAEGRVDLDWTLDQESDHRICFNWRERGGPAVTPPRSKGLGSRLLVAHGGLLSVKLDYAPEGFRCEIVAEGGSNLK